MPTSSIIPSNWFYATPPAEMQGATMQVFYDPANDEVRNIVSYIGSTVFQMTPKVTRRYDLDSRHKVGPYCRAIEKKLLEGGLHVKRFTFQGIGAQKALADFAHGMLKGFATVNLTNSYPPVWANSPWGTTNVLNPGEDMAKQMRSDADDLLSMLNGNAPTAGSTPATGNDPPVPAPREVEGDPTSNKIAPHRRSVIKNLRDPKTYLASLLR